ncbi:TetR/AcrR family transcriptional regulator [Zhongshania aliphaticivorans]|uniref:TetR/AcrR family transcriptional regulator n=1 Tax=Zhongshania aliphaticivorans TaxID=1470434 RepID=UPI0012E5091A|nr:TetR/AcrR family transcriptional regulator [Zhongshania aliphaticivorans]CAA0092987.1 HTH-type transcriptional regulator TtgR [Zhongshania aliphaticivorans]
MNGPENQQKLTQAERVAKSDERMLEVANELILEIGTEKTTLKEVGERAGYSRGLASARFGSKEELFKRILTEHRKLWYHYLHETDNKSGIDSILTRINAVEHIIINEPDNIKVMYTLWFDSLGHPSVLSEELVRYNTESQQGLTKVLEDGIGSGEFPTGLDVHQFVIDYYSRIYGLIYQWLVTPDVVDIKRSLASLKKYCELVLIKNILG